MTGRAAGGNPAITDAGLAQLANLVNLRKLGLRGAEITDAGLAHLAGLENLEALDLEITPIGDAGLIHLKGLKLLHTLWLSGTNVTDAGLVHLEALPNVERLILNSTRVTGAGLERLRKARPGIVIDHRPGPGFRPIEADPAARPMLPPAPVVDSDGPSTRFPGRRTIVAEARTKGGQAPRRLGACPPFARVCNRPPTPPAPESPLRASFPCLIGLLIIVAAPAARGEPPRFELNAGDRVVLVGDTLIERDQRYGYLETMLTLLNPGKDLTFRNLGWSGDTVAGVSRAGFDPPEAGYRQLIEQVLAARPTVLIVGYGMADSFDGEAGRPRFVDGLNRFLDAVASTKARVVLLTPIAHARQGDTLPDPAPHRAMLELYARSIAGVAQSRGAWFIDLFGPTRDREARAAITDDGIHLTDAGYRLLAGQIVRGLDPTAAREVPHIDLDADGTAGGDAQRGCDARRQASASA